MTSSYHLHGNGTPPDQLARGLAAFPGLVPGGRRTVVRRRCDTFDWRLLDAGLTLEWHDDGRRQVLELCDLAGGRVERQIVVADRSRSGVPDTGSPALELPEGRIRQRVEPVLGLRALLPRATVEVERTEFARRNRDDKTVARVALEQRQVVGLDARSSEVRVESVRGYERAAARLADELEAHLELHRIDDADHEVLTLLGITPGDYSSKLRLDLDPGEPALVALARVFEHLLATMEANEDGVRADLDTEFLHDFRVAVRRTRSLLVVARPLLPVGRLDPFVSAFRDLAAATGPARDLDVHLLGFDEMATHVPPDFRGSLEPLRALLVEQHAGARAALVAALDGPRWAALRRDWRATLATMAADSLRSTDGSEPDTIEAVAARSVRRAHRRLVRDGRAVTADSPPEALHDLRKRAKVLRYRLEAFGPVLGAGADDAVRPLKALQDVLGTYQDADVQVDTLRALAAELSRRDPDATDTIVAIGMLVNGLYDDQRASRAEFAAAFARFDAPATAAAYRTLTRADRSRPQPG